jgi:hypothetical protein
MACSVKQSVYGQSVKKITPIKSHGKYIFKMGKQSLAVNPNIGGRVVSLKYDGTEFLTGKKVNHAYWGSTFWLSPQRKWPWPVSPEIDNEPYKVSMHRNVLKMESSKDPKTGIIVTKRIYANKIGDYFALEYTITNSTDSTQQVAPWEVTRVHVNGLAFFPMGKGKLTGGLLPLTTKENGIIWFNYNWNKVPINGNKKLYADASEGWAAEINGRIIFVKQFPIVPIKKIAPNEAEVELYTSPVKPGESYVEMETQGAYEQLAPGDSLKWKVKWYIRKLPDSIKVETGNSSLVAYVRDLIE